MGERKKTLNIDKVDKVRPILEDGNALKENISSEILMR